MTTKTLRKIQRKIKNCIQSKNIYVLKNGVTYLKYFQISIRTIYVETHITFLTNNKFFFDTLKN